MDLEKDIAAYCVDDTADVRRAVEVIDRNKDGIALVIDNAKTLLGTVTDGDVRRYLLNGGQFSDPVGDLMCTHPVTASADSSKQHIKDLLWGKRLTVVPLIDAKGIPVALARMRDLLAEQASDRIAVIMAGGEGKRLRPITENIPKPMVKVGGSPILEQIIIGLRESGIKRISIALNYRGSMIEEYFQDGDNFGVQITYVKEQTKLGTAGALSLLEPVPSEPLLVMNGDVLTSVNYERLFDFHAKHRSAITVAATDYHLKVPFGVLDLAGHHVLGLKEKPVRQFYCNAGIYIIEPDLLQRIPDGATYDMSDLLIEAIEDGLPVSAFPIHEYWIDVGEHDALEQARNDHADACE